MDDALVLDGNAVAGLLREIFAVEMTAALLTCAGCGATEPIGATRVYRGAGIVLRCPHCSNPLATIVQGGAQMWVAFRGMRTLQIP